MSLVRNSVDFILLLYDYNSMSYVRENIVKLNQMKGATLRQVFDAFDYQGDKFEQLSVGTNKQKGIIGDFLEEIITGEVKDNLCEADTDIGDIKSVNVKDDGMPYENLRLTAINFNKIQNTPYNQSGLFIKSKIILIKYILNKDDVANSTIHSVGYIDLTQSKQAQQDYFNVQQIVKQGLAHTLTSKKDQPYASVVKTYSHGSGVNMKSYKVGQEQHQAKGKAFYLFKNELETFYEEINV